MNGQKTERRDNSNRYILFHGLKIHKNLKSIGFLLVKKKKKGGTGYAEC